jgi:4a-hydroxytetrahydrobiopterin dehydratase
MVLTRTEISSAVSGLGWRYLLGALCTAVPADSVGEAAALVTAAAAECGPDADGHFWAEVRADRALLTLQDLATAQITPTDLTLAARISVALEALGRYTTPQVGTGPRSVQLIEIAIDAMDIPAIRPFWQAVLGYVSEPGHDGPRDPLVDPHRRDPAVWFQQMTEPRTDRNRIHFDISVPHDEAPHRLAAALAAGGVLVLDSRAPAFWVLADAEGNEACVTTWQGRD